jgi:high-affinity iron transporter
MLQAFVITLREGLEAFLIIAISLAYLRKSRRAELIPAVHWGIGASIVLALAAAVSVATLTIHMWRHAKRIKRDIEGHLQSSTLKSGTAAFAGVFLFTLLMITREGMETALLMGTLLFTMQAPTDLLIGAVGGMTLAAFVASLWSRFGHRVNLGLFFQVTFTDSTS